MSNWLWTLQPSLKEHGLGTQPSKRGTLSLNSKLLYSLAKEIKNNLEEIARLEVLGGKPISQAREDVEASIEVFEYYAERALNINR
jgi:acyl-CoA reductase-like NAD-dependent aldehyde dehydrogenase